MAKSKGWIKIDRSLAESDVWKAREPFDIRSAWVDLLLMANFAPHDFISKGRTVHLEPGQLITSETILANRWRWSRGKVHRALKQLSEQGMILVNGTALGTTLTIVKWDFFQGSRTALRASDGTTDGTTDGALYKNVKNDKEGKEAQTRKGGRRWKTQAEKSAAVRELAARLDREEREREQRANG